MSDPEPSKPRLWWRRALSVRAMMVVVLLVGGGLGWLVYRARVQREAVAAIEAAGGQVTYDWQLARGGIAPPSPDPPWPKWLVDVLGVDYLGDAVEVGFVADESKDRINDATWHQIGRLAHLRSIGLRGVAADSGLATLKGLSRLEDLDLSDNPSVTDAGLIHLRDLARLRRLDLSTTGVRGPGLAHLARLKGLEDLSMFGVAPADADLARLAGLTSLQSLTFSGVRLTDDGLAHLKGMTNLKHLHFDGHHGPTVTIKSLANLAPLRQLESLSISGTRVESLDVVANLENLRELTLVNSLIDDAGLAPVSSLRRLESLSLIYSKVGDAGLAHLAGLANLSRLILDGPGITDIGLAHIAGLRNLHELSLFGTGITDAGLARLGTMSQLESVSIVGPKISPEGIAVLKKALPETQVNPASQP